MRKTYAKDGRTITTGSPSEQVQLVCSGWKEWSPEIDPSNYRDTGETIYPGVNEISNETVEPEYTHTEVNLEESDESDY